MASLPSLKYRALDANGDPISGAKLYAYAEGTTTPQDTYSDEALTSANANPVVADGDGWFGKIYLSNTLRYKFQLKDASDNQLWELDNVAGDALVLASVETRVGQIAANPLDYGAIGDGVADESSEVQSAIDGATGTVDLLGKTFRCDSAITLASGITLKNGTLDFSNCTDDEYIVAQGSIASEVALSGDAAAGDVSVTTADTTGIADGDRLLIVDSANNADDVEVNTVVASTSITFQPALQEAHTTANTAGYRKITELSKITIEGVTVTCSTGASGNGIALFLNYTNDVLVKDCRFNTVKDSAITARISRNVKIDNCVFDETADGLVKLEGSTNVVVRDCEFKTTPVASIGLRCGTDPVIASICRHVKVTDCVFSDCSTGVDMRDYSRFGSVLNCSFYGDGTTANRTGVVTGDQTRVIGNYFEFLQITGVYVDSSAVISTSGIVVANNNFVDVSSNNGAIYIFPAASETIGNVVVSGNTISNPTSANTYGVRSPDGGDVNRLVVANNIIRDCNFAVSIDRASSSVGESTIVTGNSVDGGTASTAMQIDNCRRLVVANNEIYSGGSNNVVTLDIDNSSREAENITVSGNSIQTTTTGPAVAITQTDTDTTARVAFVGNTVDGSTSDGIVEITGYITQLTVSGNCIQNATTASGSECLQVAGSAAAAIVGVAISGNSFDGGNYGIDISNTSKSIHDGNVFTNQGTGTTTGTFTTAGDSAS